MSVEPTAVGNGMFRPKWIQRSCLEAEQKTPGCFVINVLPDKTVEETPFALVLPSNIMEILAELLTADPKLWAELDIDTGEVRCAEDWQDLKSNQRLTQQTP